MKIKTCAVLALLSCPLSAMLAEHAHAVCVGAPNGAVHADEACDDGNDIDGDGCSSTCEIEAGWTCDRPVSFTGIRDESYAGANANWSVTSDGRSGKQTINTDHGTFGLMGARAFAATYSFLLKVEETSDDDFIGFALGFSSGEVTAGAATNYLLLDWKQGNQTLTGNVVGKRGIALSHVTGTPTFNDLWGHTGPVRELLRSPTHTDTGWGDNVEYQFAITYTANTLRVVVDDVVAFNVTAAELGFTQGFPDGEIAFYGLSQPNVRYTVTGPFGSTSCNLPPQAQDHVVHVSPGGASIVVGVLDGFEDPNGDDANGDSTRVVSQPSGATATGASGGSAGTVTLTPNTVGGSQSFELEYEICDDHPTVPLCDTATLTVHVGPSASNDTLVAAQDVGNTFLLSELLGNDQNVDHSLYTFVFDESSELGGSVVVDPVTGVLVYTPPAGFAGEDHFGYTLCSVVDPEICVDASVTVGVVQCLVDAQCGAQVCNPVTNTCVGCYANAAGAPDHGCDEGQPLCDETAGECFECLVSADCAGDDVCFEGTCALCHDTADAGGVDAGCSAAASVCVTTDEGLACTACGDGIRADDEACDDGNTTDGDGCSARCAIEGGWTCDIPVSFTGIVTEGYGTDANWNVSADGRAGTQTINTNHGTFGLMGADAFAATYNFVLRVEDNDDDFIGFALGFSPGETTAGTDTDYLLLDWKKANQDTAKIGLALSHVTAAPAATNFWNHDGPVEEIHRSPAFGTTGWQRGVDYQVAISYTADTLRVVIDDAEAINITAAQFGARFPEGFPGGQIVFYGYSQPHVTYTLTGPFGSTSCNRPPRLTDLVVTVPPSDLSIAIPALGGFSDPDGDAPNPASVRVVTPPDNATAIGASGGEAGVVTVTPNQPGGSQTIVLTYEVCDTHPTVPLCDTATLTVHIGPTVTDDEIEVAQDVGTPVLLTDLIGNDGNIDDELYTVGVGETSTNGGVVTYDPETGELVYTPPAGFTGEDSFEYTLCSVHDAEVCVTATVTVTVRECLADAHCDGVCDLSSNTCVTCLVTDGEGPDHGCSVTNPVCTTTDSGAICASICGDGLKAADEACDDGNTDAGDGCDAGCKIEHGFDCAAELAASSVCASTCGDGAKASNEACDDGNLVSGDGCSATCGIEDGFDCGGELASSCVAHCGDGLVVGAEACDDGNLDTGDGCDAACAIEPGWECEQAPSVCSVVCGDGLVVGEEACDDGNTDNRDGCADDCTVEPGYECDESEPSACASTCGDGVVASDEACDDGNLEDGDGCSATCGVETGYSCEGEPSECAPGCGNGVKAAVEACDDGNLEDGDGCSAACAIEEGWSCEGVTPSVCETVCGDGVKTADEACDDGNAEDGDGCSATCVIDEGWSCEGTTPSVCTSLDEGLVAMGGGSCGAAGPGGFLALLGVMLWLGRRRASARRG